MAFPGRKHNLCAGLRSGKMKADQRITLGHNEQTNHRAGSSPPKGQVLCVQSQGEVLKKAVLTSLQSVPYQQQKSIVLINDRAAKSWVTTQSWGP